MYLTYHYNDKAQMLNFEQVVHMEVMLVPEPFRIQVHCVECPYVPDVYVIYEGPLAEQVFKAVVDRLAKRFILTDIDIIVKGLSEAIQTPDLPAEDTPEVACFDS